MCTVAQNLINIGEQRGEIKGEKNGEIKGRTEERSDTIKNMINNGFTTEQISKFCGYDLDFVIEVVKSLA
jgi:predicted transposase YdaD